MTFRTISRDNYILNALIMLSIQFLYNNCCVFLGVFWVNYSFIYLQVCCFSTSLESLPKWQRIWMRNSDCITQCTLTRLLTPRRPTPWCLWGWAVWPALSPPSSLSSTSCAVHRWKVADCASCGTARPPQPWRPSPPQRPPQQPPDSEPDPKLCQDFIQRYFAAEIETIIPP